MLEIKALENATVDVVKGSFPLGQRNTIKINIEDNAIRQYIKPDKTGKCKPEDNFFSYGNFDYESDISKVSVDLTEGSSVEIVSGESENYSNCLSISTTNPQGLGECYFTPDKDKLEIGKKYILSFSAKCNKANIFYIGIGDRLNSVVGTGFWEFYKYEFEATDEIVTNNRISISILNECVCFIDNLQLFDSDKEIIENIYNNIGVEIEILNPVQATKIQGKINKIVNLEITKEAISLVMYMPPITVVDYQDNLLCKLLVTVLQPSRVQTLGDSIYNDIKTYIYVSEPFVLNGFVFSNGYNTGEDEKPEDPEPSNPGDGCDCDCKHELVIEEI